MLNKTIYLQDTTLVSSVLFRLVSFNVCIVSDLSSLVS